MNKNNNKNPLNSLIEINKKILPFFSNPIILKKINDQKKNKDLNSLNPQKKLIYKIIKLNENLVKFTTSIKNYNLNLDSFFFSNISSNESKISYPLDQTQTKEIKVGNNKQSLQSKGLLINKIEDRGFNLQKNLNMSVGNKSEFILFTRNNLYYNLKYRISNIMYKIEKFIPLLKFYSLLNNINLFAPKRLLKPQPYIRFTYRIIQLNNSFNFKKVSSSKTLLQNASLIEALNADVTRKKGNANLRSLKDTTSTFPTLTVQSPQPSLTSTNLSLANTQRAGNIAKVKTGASSVQNVNNPPFPAVQHPKLDGGLLHNPSALPVREGGFRPPLREGMAGRREQVLTKINNYNNQYDNSIIRLYKFENARSIKYLLLKLDNLLNEIENIINIKNKLIKIIKIKNIINLSSFDRNGLDFVNSNTSPNQASSVGSVCGETPNDSNLSLSSQSIIKEKDKLDLALTVTEHRLSEVEIKHKENLLNQLSSTEGSEVSVGVAEEIRPSNQSVQNLRLKIKRINSSTSSNNNNNNKNIETYPLLIEAGMVKDNKIKIEKNIKSILPTIQTKPLLSRGSLVGLARKFDAEKDIINENSNPVDLLYFNNNLKKPVINQYLKSMSTYNMITNGTILYYSNIIGFNFKNRIRTYLPFIKAISPIASKRSTTETLPFDININIKKGERLTSPYSFRSIRKVVGSLDKGKFSIFGRGIENNKLINNIYKFLYLSFKSMYCLISKPVFIIKSNKIIIQLFYFLLIPKIFKHIKSKTKNKPIKKNGKRIYLSLIEKRKKQALAALFESRLKQKEYNIKKNYFMQHSFNFNRELINSNNTSIMTLNAKSAPLLNLTYKNEFVELRKAEEKISGVKFDKSGMVKLDSIEHQLDKLSSAYATSGYGGGQLKQRNHKLNLSSLSLNGNGITTGLDTAEGTAKLKNKKIKFIKDNKIKKSSYKMFFKRFEFNNINNDLHILRIPKNLAILSLSKSNDFKKKNYDAGQYRSEWMRSRSLQRNLKLFKYLALTYLNIFKFKDRRNILNRIKLKISSDFAKKELIKDKSYLVSYNSKDYAVIPTKLSDLHSQHNGVGIKGNNRRNKFNSYNQINWYLFKKLFWSIRLSKKIIPNAKILQKLGIPQWNWPYSNIKKGYNISHMPYSQSKKVQSVNNLKLSQDLSSSIPLSGVTTGLGTNSAKTNLSYSWPFSLLMSPTILQLNKKVNLSPTNTRWTDNLNSKIQPTLPTFDNSNNLIGKDNNSTQRFPGLLLEGGASSAPSASSFVGGMNRMAVIQKQNRYKIRELYTKRYHLMKLANINLVKVYPLKFEKLCEVLNSIFNKPVELDLIRLHYPYNDSNILVRLLAFMINKMKLRRITRRLFNKAVVKSIKKINNKDQVNIIPAFLSGMTIKVAGRLMKYKVVPRKTVKIVRRGSSSIGKINYSDISRYTNKNKRGSFTITIKSGQNFFN